MNRTPCRHLRNKKLYIPGQEHEAFDDADNAAAQCWCNRTMTAIGDDDGLVTPEACSNPERSCFA